jgi:hypothetical protein
VRRLLRALRAADTGACGVKRINSRSKGKRGELEFINRHLRPFWPNACRNIDQFGDQKQDCLNVAGVHWQIKRTERFEFWKAVEQATSEAASTDVPIVAVRRNRSKWYCVIEADELVDLLRFREQA